MENHKLKPLTKENIIMIKMKDEEHWTVVRGTGEPGMAETVWTKKDIKMKDVTELRNIEDEKEKYYTEAQEELDNWKVDVKEKGRKGHMVRARNEKKKEDFWRLAYISERPDETITLVDKDNKAIDFINVRWPTKLEVFEAVEGVGGIVTVYNDTDSMWKTGTVISKKPFNVHVPMLEKKDWELVSVNKIII